ncbi:CTAG/Pcc1 family [Protomyces lactucae-debilis]|uniref:CTAG/Pcc1 family n=1 Tax=Protomyces lactucae-debilis TaxID=2754530 RepID=A0A1Y2FM70_PROLT|nr:CTAG/Pcc1 family [Protomyces lactucae-debilis]ORY84454.1 CTAG/Pcc1 family [Protomyces lactucae-debilis]
MSTILVRVPFPTEALAQIACRSLSPDAEVKPDQVSKTVSVEGRDLLCRFQCTSARTSRVSLNAFFDSLEVVVRTMDELADL